MADASKQNSNGKPAGWTFLTNHSHVLICLALEPDMLLREVAQKVGITERAVQKIVLELEEGGVLVREKVGRRNHYTIKEGRSLRHPVEGHRQVRDLLDMVRKGNS
ncbi:MAG: winged helix-turn-helix transcriptional regulator [Phycisphaeraceae bacterium]|nr:winged helix-turn-helix transcriptional regulator [Phycisphaeraceae bacterium]